MNAVVKTEHKRRCLLLGAGNQRMKSLQCPDSPDRTFAGYDLVTLDIDPTTSPDVLHDLNVLPLPFADDEFDEIHAYEVMEHCGRQGDWQFFFAQFAEIWRILKPGGLFCATVPAWDSMWAWADPGHTRVIAEGNLIFLCQPEYAKQIGKTSMTDYSATWRGDFDIRASGTERDTFAFVLATVKPSRWTPTRR